MRKEERAIIINVDFCISHLYGETMLVWLGRVQCAPFHTGYNTLAMSENSCCVFFNTVRSQSTMIMMRMSRLNLICININKFNSNFDAYNVGPSRKKLRTRTVDPAQLCKHHLFELCLCNQIHYKYEITELSFRLYYFQNYWKLIRVVVWVFVDSIWRCTHE